MARLRTDWTLFLTILAMTGFGIVMVFSASSAAAISSAAGISSAASKPLNDVQPYIFGLHQIGFAVISFVVLMYFKRLDYRALNTPAWAFSGLGIVLGCWWWCTSPIRRRTAGSRFRGWAPCNLPSSPSPR